MKTMSESFSFDTKANTALKKWLDDAQIEELRCRAKLAKRVWFEDAKQPTLACEKSTLQRMAELSIELSELLKEPPPTADAELDLVFRKHFGGWEQKDVMVSNLEILSSALSECLDKMPVQEYKKSPVFLVSQITEVLQSASIKTSATENSRFFQICDIVFKSAGITQSPAGAIRAFMKVTG